MTYSNDSMSYQISLKLAQLFKADSTLNDIKAIYIGEPLFIPQHHFPCLITAVQSQILVDAVTGLHYYTYTGLVAVEDQLPDDTKAYQEDDDRLFLVDSYFAVNYFLDLASNIVEQKRNLDSLLNADNEQVLVIRQAQKTYFTNARVDGFTDRGQYQFTVDSQKNEVIS